MLGVFTNTDRSTPNQTKLIEFDNKLCQTRSNQTQTRHHSYFKNLHVKGI